MSNPLPVDVVKKMGAGLTIAVNLHPHLKVSEIKRYVKSGAAKIGIEIFPEDIQYADEKHGVSVPDNKKGAGGWLKNINQWLNRENEKNNHPNIFEVLFQAIDIMEYVNTQNMLKYNSPTVLIEPDLLHMGTLDFHEAKNIIDVGKAAAADKRFELIRKIKFWI